MKFLGDVAAVVYDCKNAVVQKLLRQFCDESFRLAGAFRDILEAFKLKQAYGAIANETVTR